MFEEAFLHNLGLIIIAAAVCALLARLVRLPTIIAYLTAGILLGPVTGLVAESEALDVISEAGIVLLLFLVGLELNIDKIRAVGRNAVIAGTAQIAITMPAGFAIGLGLGFNAMASGVLAVGLTLSSTVVVVKTLVEQKATSSVHGQTAIGILLVQDLFVIILLTVLAGLGDVSGGELEPAVILGGIGRAMLSMAAVLAGVYLAARHVLPRPFNWARLSRETVFVASLAWCFAAVLVAHALHLSAEIGAFLAGIGLAQLPHAHDLQRRVTPLMNCFVAVFFVTLGAAVSFPAQAMFWIKIIVLCAFVVVGKFAVIFAITRKLGYPAGRAFDSALLLIQISEFSFIFAAAAAASGLIGEGGKTLLAIVGLTTITISALAQLGSKRLRKRFLGMPVNRGHTSSPADADSGYPEGHLLNHVIIVGMNTLGRELAKRLHWKNELVLAVDTDPQKLAGLPCLTMEGDASTPTVLAEAHIENAKLLVSTLHITETNELLAYHARAAGIPTAIHIPDVRRTAHLLELDVAYLMSSKADGLKQQWKTLRELGLLGPA